METAAVNHIAATEDSSSDVTTAVDLREVYSLRYSFRCVTAAQQFILSDYAILPLCGDIWATA